MPRRKTIEMRGPADVLPIFGSAMMGSWQLILPRNMLVVYHPDRDA